MADISRIARFVSGMPRSIDLQSNALVVGSLKVGASSPVEITKTMSQLLSDINAGSANSLGLPTANIATGAVTDVKLAASAKQAVLESKVAAFRTTVANFSADGTTDVVTDDVVAAAKAGAVKRLGANVAAVTLPGIYVGTVSGPSDLGKVLVRAAGTDNGIYGSEDEVYAKLTEVAGVYILSYFETIAGVETAFAMPAATAIDFYFVELYDMYALPTDRFLMAPVGGVVDATSVGTTADLQTLIQGAAGSSTTLSFNPDLVYVADGGSVKAAIVALDGQAKSLQDEIDAAEATIGSFMDGDGGVLGFSGSNYMDAEITLTAAMEALDTQLKTTTDLADDLVTLSGVAANATALGDFSGATYLTADTLTVKSALAALDTAVDGVAQAVGAVAVDASVVEFTDSGEALVAGDVVYLKAADGLLWKADASALASSEAVVGIVKEVIDGGANPDTIKVTVTGKVTVTCATGDLDVGKRAYLSLVAGEATKTAPSTADEVVYLLGIAVAGSGTSYTLILQPSLQYVVE